MPGIFSIIDSIKKAYHGYREPREFAREVSFGFAEGFLWVIITIIGLAIIVSLVLERRGKVTTAESSNTNKKHE